MGLGLLVHLFTKELNMALEFTFGPCALENSIYVLYQVCLFTHGVDVRINLACSRCPLSIIINHIIQPWAKYRIPLMLFHCAAHIPGETVESSLETGLYLIYLSVLIVPSLN